MLLTYQNF